MNMRIGLFGVVLLLLAPKWAASQSTIVWHATSMGFAVSTSPTTMLKSLVGQSFVGTSIGNNTTIESGFLVDTLMRVLPVAVVDQNGVPAEYALYQNHPNPFNASTTIRIGLPQAVRVTLRVYNLLGQEVLTLMDEERPPGLYDIHFQANGLSSGMYLYRLQAGTYVQTKKLLLLK